MKLKHIIAVTVGAAALCAPSCDLDEKFYSEVTPDTFFTSPESTYAVLCRPFTHWKWYIGADRWYLQELTTDEMVCPKRGSDWYNSGEYYRLHYHTWSPDDRFVVNTYDGTTGGISRALEAKSDLQGVDYNAIGLNDAVKADHINQLNAITAYFYMRGLDYFGGMPIYYSVDDDLCARSTARETYAHIETLLKDAIPALSKKTTLGASEDGYIKQAAGLINQVRGRNFEGGADPNPVTADNLDEYRMLDEWMIEFLGEGRRRTDLIRWDKFVTESWWDHTPLNDKNKNLFPIPNSAISANNLIEQNPGN